jgi:hypothetical protein
MAENNNVPLQKPPAIDPATLGLAMLNAGMTQQIGLLLTIPVPATDVINLLCEHIGKLLALIEPEQLRNSILGEIRRNLPAVVNRHVEARMTTPGGILIPDAAQRMQ